MTAASAPRLPDFVVLGQGKAGTSLIYRVLGHNPLIGLSYHKELHYFTRRFDKGVDWYASHFAHVPNEARLVGEVSPSYLKANVVERIANVLGRDTKVIFVLRRPVEQAYSRYLQDICADQRNRTFSEFVSAMPTRLDRVFAAITRCYELFGRDRVLPLFYETDISGADPRFETRILDFLGLPSANFAQPYIDGKTVNPGIMPRYLYSGQEALKLHANGQTFVLPPRHLAFCGQERNSWVRPNPGDEAVLDAMVRQSNWTPAVTEHDYYEIRRKVVLPVAKQMEDAFGFDLSHWRNAPRHIAYDPAPPPNELRQTKDTS